MNWLVWLRREIAKLWEAIGEGVSVAWADITGKPTEFNPTAHTHGWSEVSNKPTEFTPAAHQHGWEDVENKPEAFPPSEHLHEYIDLYFWGKVKYGFLYNWHVLNNIVNTENISNWRIPLNVDIQNLISAVGSNNADKVKITNIEPLGSNNHPYWRDYGLEYTNSLNLSIVPSGYRYPNTGEYMYLTSNARIWSATERSTTGAYVLSFNYINNNIGLDLATGYRKTYGLAIRLVRDLIENESILPDGTIISNAYIGNNGRVYNGVKIGSLVWITENLAETKYNNGDNILLQLDSLLWENETIGQYCFYDNDIDLALFKEVGYDYNKLKNIPSEFTPIAHTHPELQQQIFGIEDIPLSRILTISDSGKLLRVNSTDPQSLTIPLNEHVAFPINTVITIRQVGTGQVTVDKADSVTVNGDNKTAGQNKSLQIIKVGTNEWDIEGGVA